MKREADDRIVTRSIVALALVLGFSHTTIETARAEPLALDGGLPAGALDARGGYRGFFLPGIAPITIAPAIECREGPAVSTGRFHDRLGEDCARANRVNGTATHGAPMSDAVGPGESLDTR
ncbi:MAG: hypothetical protein ACE5LF_05510 [Alphaproteobacteria bacterium]